MKTGVFFGGFLIYGLTFVGVCDGQELDEVCGNVGTVQFGNFCGTGFVVYRDDETELVVTNRHVATTTGGPIRYTRIDQRGNASITTGTVVETSSAKNEDWAVVRVIRSSIKTPNWVFNLDGVGDVANRRVWSVGCAACEPISIQVRTIRKETETEYRGRPESISGQSGGPLVVGNNQVIGIVTFNYPSHWSNGSLAVFGALKLPDSLRNAVNRATPSLAN